MGSGMIGVDGQGATDFEVSESAAAWNALGGSERAPAGDAFESIPARSAQGLTGLAMGKLVIGKVGRCGGAVEGQF